MLGCPAHLALAHELDQARFRQLGDVVVRVAEGDLQLVAEIAGGEDAAAVEAEDFEDRDAEGVSRRPRQALPSDRDRSAAWSAVFRCTARDFAAPGVAVEGVSILDWHIAILPKNVDSSHYFRVEHPTNPCIGSFLGG